MFQKLNRIFAILAILTLSFGTTILAQRTRDRRTPDWCDRQSGLNGLYRIDLERSDRLYSVIEGASSSVPFSEQQQFFIDLAVRLAPPDLLAIECRDKTVALASSRAARVEFVADGVTRSVRTSNGENVRTRFWFDGGGLTFTSSGGGDNLNFNFLPVDGGSALRVTRRIYARELIAPIVIRTVYKKVSDVASWDVFDDSQIAARSNDRSSTTKTPRRPQRPPEDQSPNDAVEQLRDALGEWIAATNDLDIERQIAFYAPQVKAFYLTRNVTINAVRAEKNRAFASAKSIAIQAAEPEIVFQNGGREAIMRFRKVYDIRTGTRRRSGEVVQELRWQRTGRGWKIFSERDIRVIR